MSRNTYIIILVLVVLGLGLFFVMNTDSGQSSDGGDMTTTTPDTGDSAKMTDDELKVWLEEYGMNTPEDIGFPTTADESDYVPPEGWVKYVFDVDSDEELRDYSEEVLNDFFGYYTGEPTLFRGFEFWYPGEFTKPSVLQTRVDFLDNADDTPGSFWLSSIDHFSQKGGYPTIFVAVSPLSQGKNIQLLKEELEREGEYSEDIVVDGRAVLKTTSKSDSASGLIFYRYAFEVGPYVFYLGYGVQNENVEEDQLYPFVVTEDGITRNDVFETFFESFKFLEKNSRD